LNYTRSGVVPGRGSLAESAIIARLFLDSGRNFGLPPRLRVGAD